jgi:hypothetical protein
MILVNCFLLIEEIILEISGFPLFIKITNAYNSSICDKKHQFPTL